MQIAAVAVARKIAMIAWHMLTNSEDYAFARPSLTRGKLRRLERLAATRRRAHWATRVTNGATPTASASSSARPSEATSGWSATGRTSKKGAGATPGRASQRPSKGTAARQASKPQASAL